MDGVNLIGKKLKDIWTVEGLPRDYVKKAITPILYGSSQTPEELWDFHDFEYTQKQVNIINRELLEGRFSNVLKFKDHIIGNVQPKVQMRVKIWNDEFDIYCNKYKWNVTTPVTYQFLTGTMKAKQVVKETCLTPDVKAFKTYFATLLCHNVDSQIADHVCKHLDWVIPIHDDFITDPNNISKVRELYVDKLRDLYVNRKQIMKDYCESIGITEEFQEINDKAVDPMSFSGHCLK